MPRFVLLALAACLTAACQITPPPSPIGAADACAIPKHVIVTAQPDEDAGGALGEEGPFNLRLRELLAPPARPAGLVEPRKGEVLFLSGGSQKGSFGAGFLKGWSERQGGLPQFNLVTGVSAGAILSTAAFIGDGRGAAERFSSISQESDVLDAFAKRNSKGDLTKGSYLNIAKRGAAADLVPMQELLIAYLKSPGPGGARVIEAARIRAMANADLFVGAVDLDSGQFVAFWLSEYLRQQDPAQPVSDHVIECYARAVRASSSVPLAALPVFIDGRVYVDGGARNGMFGWQLLNELTQLSMSRGPDPVPAPNLYLIVNGNQEIDPDCGAYRKQKIAPAGPSQAQDDFCRKVVGDPQVMTPKRPTWSIDGVGLRSVDVLVNQVYRASAQAIFQAYQLAYQTRDGFHFARMRPDARNFRLGERTCGSGAGYVPSDGVETWYDLDDRTRRPLEFYPNYMKCLIAYGEQTARTANW